MGEYIYLLTYLLGYETKAVAKDRVNLWMEMTIY